MDSDLTVTAEFATVHNLQLDLYFSEYGFPYYFISSGNVSVNGTQVCSNLVCSYSFGEGEAVTMEAHPDFGSRLLKWEGACAGELSNTCTLTIDSSQPINMVVFAVFGMGN